MTYRACAWVWVPDLRGLFPVSSWSAGRGRHAAGHEDAGAVRGGPERPAVQHRGHGGVQGEAEGRQQHGGGGRSR